MENFLQEAKNLITEGINEKIQAYNDFNKDKKWLDLEINAFDQPLFAKEIIYHGNKSEEKLIDLYKKFDNKWTNVIYVFFSNELPDEYNNKEKADLNIEKLNKKHKKDFNKTQNCMPDVNDKKHWKKTKYGYCLYVGKCSKDPKNRIKYHFSEITKTGTYGLHLGASKCWINQKITVFVLVFGSTISTDFLQPIEDKLWDTYHPLFGKKGPR